MPIAFLALLLAGACKSAAPRDAEPVADVNATGTESAPVLDQQHVETAQPEGTPEAAPADTWRTGTIAGMSAAGTYRVHYRPVGGAIERGQPFGLEVWVLDPETEEPRTDVSLAADAAMPQHEHGMNREPKVTPRETSPSGAFEVEGMLFHMLGRWELYLDVTHGAVTERTQFEVRLE